MHGRASRCPGIAACRRISRSVAPAITGAAACHARSPPPGGGPHPIEKMFLCISLRTHVPGDAKILTRRLTEMSDLVFAASAETVMAIAPEIQVRMLEGIGRFEIAAFERARAFAGPRSPESAAMDLRREEALQATLRQALWLGDSKLRSSPRASYYRPWPWLLFHQQRHLCPSRLNQRKPCLQHHRQRCMCRRRVQRNVSLRRRPSDEGRGDRLRD